MCETVSWKKQGLMTEEQRRRQWGKFYAYVAEKIVLEKEQSN